MEKHLLRQKLLRYALIAAAAGALIWLAFPIVLPFAVGLIPALTADKAVHRLQTRLPIPRWAAACILVGLWYILCLLAVLTLGKLLLAELEGMLRTLPDLSGALAQPLRQLKDRLLLAASRFPDGIGAAMEAWVTEFFRSGAGLGQKLYDWVFSAASSLLRQLPDLAVFSLTALLSSFMLCIELPKLKALWLQKAPASWQAALQRIPQKLKGTLFCWLKAQGKLLLVTFLVLTAGLLIIGIRYPIGISALIAALDALPVLGSGAVLIPWSMVQFLLGDTFRGVGLLCIYGAAALTRAALEPRLLGRQMGLDPLLTLFALYAGFRLFGIWGMILFPMGAMFLRQILH